MRIEDIDVGEKLPELGERFRIQSHHLFNFEGLVIKMGSAIDKKYDDEDINYPWEVASLVDLRKMALREADSWAVWMVERFLKDALSSRRKLPGAMRKLGISPYLIEKLSVLARERWLAGEVFDLSSMAEYELGFSTYWVDKNCIELQEATYWMASSLYYQDLFGELPKMKVGEIMKMAKAGKVQGVSKMITGYRELGYRFIRLCGEQPESVLRIDREIDDVCFSGGGDREHGLHCAFPQRNFDADRNAAAFNLLAARGEDMSGLIYTSDRGVEAIDMSAKDLWLLLSLYDWI